MVYYIPFFQILQIYFFKSMGFKDNLILLNSLFMLWKRTRIKLWVKDETRRGQTRFYCPCELSILFGTNFGIELNMLGFIHIPEICFRPPNVWHKFLDKIENVGLIHIPYTGSSRKNDKSKSVCTGVNFQKKWFLWCVLGWEIAANLPYRTSETPTITLRHPH